MVRTAYPSGVDELQERYDKGFELVFVVSSLLHVK